MYIHYICCVSIRAKQFREAMAKKHEVDCGLAMIVKQRAAANEIERMDLVGSVQGCDAIIGMYLYIHLQQCLLYCIYVHDCMIYPKWLVTEECIYD